MATKNKTNKSVKKRVRVTATGKLKYGKVGRRHLSERMHSGIRAARTSRCDCLLGKRRKCFLQRVLNRAAMRLRLPALPAAAVILEAERNSFQRDTQGCR